MKNPNNLLNRIAAITGAIVIVIVAGMPSLAAQESLGDVIRASGHDWIEGKWTATSDDGGSVLLNYEWDLDKHIVKTHLKMGDTEARGMTVFDASNEKAIYVSADNQGNFGRGEWQDRDGEAVLKYHSKTPSGEERHMAIVHSKAGANAMRVEIYALEGDTIGDTAYATLNFKK